MSVLTPNVEHAEGEHPAGCVNKCAHRLHDAFARAPGHIDDRGIRRKTRRGKRKRHNIGSPMTDPPAIHINRSLAAQAMDAWEGSTVHEGASSAGQGVPAAPAPIYQASRWEHTQSPLPAPAPSESPVAASGPHMEQV